MGKPQHKNIPSVSRRKAAGTRRNKKHRFVGTQGSDRKA